MSDPTDSAVIPVGKQTLNPSHIFYRSCSGIWQQVWIESVPKDHISRLDVAADMDGQGRTFSRPAKARACADVYPSQ